MGCRFYRRAFCFLRRIPAEIGILSKYKLDFLRGKNYRRGMFGIVLLILAGAVLIFLETVLVGGIWAAAGIACCAWGVWDAYASFGGLGAAAAALFSVAACVGAFLFWLYVLPKTKWGKKIYLSSSQSGKAPHPDYSALVGRTGVAESALMPSGKVNIGGAIYDARTDYPHVEPGGRVEVVGFDSFSLKVRKI